MKEILVGVDFSEKSIHALTYALHLAHGLGARLNLLHVYEDEITFKHIPEVIRKQLNEGKDKEALEAFHSFADSISDKLGIDIPISCKIEEGKVSREIIRYSNKIAADVIVLGTWRVRGARNSLDSRLKNVGAGIINNSSKAVLFVPEKTRGFSLRHLAYATNFRERDQRIPDILKELAKRLRLNTSCINVRRPEKAYSRIQFDLLEQMKAMEEEGQEINFFSLSGENIIETIDSFVKSEGVHMLAILKHEKLNVFERILEPDIPQLMAFYSHVPLLILQEQRS